MHIRLPDPDVRYIAFGDSSTAGVGTCTYPDVLRKLLDESPGALANEGHGGESSHEGLARLRALLSRPVYPNAETLLYWEGAKDITEFIAQNDPHLRFSPDDSDYPLFAELTKRLDATQSQVEAAIAAGRGAELRVYVATYYPLGPRVRPCPVLPAGFILPSQADRGDAYIARLNQRIRRAAMNQGAILVDIGADADAFRSDSRNYLDCSHLSERGNRIVAEIFVEVLSDTSERVHD